MENGTGILFILTIICFIATIFTRADSDFFVCCLSATCSFLISLFVISIIYDWNPTAMDVYQGKTTLEYKVVNGVKVDSCVILKEK